MRFAQTTRSPIWRRSSNLDGFDLTREVMYVETVAAEPRAPPVRHGQQFGEQEQRVVADSERIIAHAGGDAAAADEAAGMDTQGVEPWAFLTWAGSTGHPPWMSNPRMSSAELIDHLTMLCWSALCGDRRGGRDPSSSSTASAPVTTAPLRRRCRRTPGCDLPSQTHDGAGIRNPGRRDRHRCTTKEDAAAKARNERCRPPSLRQRREGDRARCYHRRCRVWSVRAARWGSGTPVSAGRPDEESAHHFERAGHIGVSDRSHHVGTVPCDKRYDEVTPSSNWLVKVRHSERLERLTSTRRLRNVSRPTRRLYQAMLERPAPNRVRGPDVEADRNAPGGLNLSWPPLTRRRVPNCRTAVARDGSAFDPVWPLVPPGGSFLSPGENPVDIGDSAAEASRHNRSG